ncbi:MAG: DNA/RNA non-specific endonuclease [Clostridia bacterium]|nr:DNA/RNA non-specific endonuclease [Clostridia bacterium]
MKRFISLCAALLCLAVFLTGCQNPFAGLRGRDRKAERFTTEAYSPPAASHTAEQPAGPAENAVPDAATRIPDAEPDSVFASLPEYSGSPWVKAADGKARFTEDEITGSAFEEYYPLDSLGRCTEALACLGRELMPTEKRGDIHEVHPTGWQSVIYDFVDGGSLYNRCHLIGFQLSGENANVRNLITGTRYLNTQGMLPFENMVADYIKETDGLVMYRVIPYFAGNDLVCRGIFMEGYSVPDNGDEINFFVFCYNVQPGVVIDYSDGSNMLATAAGVTEPAGTYILNKHTGKFHLPSCKGAADISEKNRQVFEGSRTELIEHGYKPCNECRP